MKNNKGITLIALVITIIVLLILAGVSIAMLTGNNGILTQANEAKVWTELGSVDNSYKTYILGLQANNNGAQVDLNSLTDLLTKVSVGDSGYVYAIKDLSKLNLSMESGKGEIPSSVTSINDFNDVYVVDEEGNVAYILNDKVYGDIGLAQGETTTREDFFEFNEETGTITGIVENTTKDPNGVGYYYDDEGNQILSEKNIVVPSTINGKPVTKIADLAFSEAEIESIVIPDTVTKIGSSTWGDEWSGAFKRCASLKSVTIPDSVTFLGAHTFSGCSSLTDITMPKNITNIYRKTFWGCRSLTNITIPDSITTIGDSAFDDCSSLTNIRIPNSVTVIGPSCFKNIYEDANIYCEATSKPAGWDEDWTNLSSSRIHWGSTGPTE